MHARISAGSITSGKPPIVLVHGLGVSSLYLIPLAEHLAPHFGVYVPDLPGFGRSEKPDHALDVRALADALAAWMDAAGIPSAPLLGNSLGCQVIAELAATYPERITHAILVGPTVDPKARTILQQIWRGVLDLPRERLSLLLICVYDYLRAGVFRFLHTLRFLVQDPIEEKLPHVQVPTLVMRGRKDPIVPGDWTWTVVRLLPDGHLITIPDAAHAAHYTAPAAVAEATRDFVQQTTVHSRARETPARQS